jgi:ABC-type transport system involved in multi-copper enzyme maturation permease subunit
MSHQWQRSRALKILIGFIVFTFVVQNMAILMMKDAFMNSPLGESITANQYLEDQLRNILRGIVSFQTNISAPGSGVSMSFGGQSIMILICVILMGSGLISDDTRYRATEVYYSKVSKTEYIMGKYGAFLLFGNLFFTLPYVIEWGLLVIGIGGVDVIAALPLLVEVIIFTEVVTLVYGSIVLAFSSLTEKRLYAGLTMFILIFMTSMLVPALTYQASEFTPLFYLDIFTTLLVFSYMLEGTTTVIFSLDFNTIALDLTGFEGMLVFPVLALFICAGLLIVLYQVVWKHST